MLEKYLQEIGLTDKESLVYLALLQVDNSSVVDIAKKTDIKRTTVYVVIDTLAKKGLVSETTVNGKTQYQAESPESLQTYIERQKLVLDERGRRLNEIIPQIKSIQRESGERPVVEFFQGKEGILSSNDRIYSAETSDGSPVYLMYSKDLVDDVFTAEEKEVLRKKRINKNIKSKVLYNSLKGEKPSDETGDRIKVDEKKYPLLCDIAVYKDKVRVSILRKKLSGIFIQSQDFADTLRSLFNLAVDNIKKPQ